MDNLYLSVPMVRKMLVAIAAAGLAWKAYAQPVPDTVAAGKALAEQYCVTCHVIAATGQGSWTDAPKFDAIANRAGVTVASLSAVIQKPHMDMLNDRRPKDQADALATYIISLRKP
jgi:mono/diheme cytochrome c family protein